MDYLKSKNYIINENILKYIDKDISFKEFLIILYFMNSESLEFDLEKISNSLNIEVNDVMEAFNNLLTKNIISLKQEKNKNNKIVDYVSLDNIYQNVDMKLQKKESKEKESSIFDLIEEEFQRKLSPIDMEIINGWLTMSTSKEIIIEALKEASYNGVKTLKFMDQKIYEWNKLNLKTKEEIENYLKSKNVSNNDEEEMFGYDWLNDDE